MKPNKQQQREKIRTMVSMALHILISTALIVYFMPRHSAVHYEFKVGSPWMYSAVIASEDIPYYKSDKQMKKERDEAERSVIPYYQLSENTKNTMLQRFYTNAAKKQDALTEKFKSPRQAAELRHQREQLHRYSTHISQLLDTIYSHGIVTKEEMDTLLHREQKSIKILGEKNVVQLRSVSQLFTEQAAYTYLLSSDSLHYSASVIKSFDVYSLIESNLKPDIAKTQSDIKVALVGISGTHGLIPAGQKIIDRGDIVTPEKSDMLRSIELAERDNEEGETILPYSVIGQSIFVSFILATLVSFISLFRIDYFERLRSTVLIFGLMVVFCIIGSLMVGHKFYHIFMLPCCMVPIITRVFLDSRTAYMLHCTTVIIISLTLSNPYEFLILQITTGMIAIQSLRELSQRSQIFRTAALIAAAYVVFYTAYQMIVADGFTSIDRSCYTYFAINGLLLLFAYPLLFLLEKLFGFVSDVTLVELSNINSPLLQQMTEIAPGTFQHSMQVANLSAEVARKIGAKAQLVRTGALYHDIGKLERPVFFTENQKGVSPHKHLSPQKSAEVIIAHVTNGLALASRYNLPDSIRRFIATHHGVGMAKFFYITYKNEHPDEEVDTRLFSYPGPNPNSKEEAILMMCDGVEAASRSLQEYTEESISELVDRIIDGQVAEGFFAECRITFRDIADAKAVLKDKLKTIYHTRISYPELENRQ